MITLNSVSIVTTAVTLNAITSTTTTDTLVISYVELSPPLGNAVVMVQQGTVVASVFTPNQPQRRLDVSPEGSFRSQDGAWSGTLPGWAPAVAALSLSLDGLLLGSGVVSGTAA